MVLHIVQSRADDLPRIQQAIDTCREQDALLFTNDSTYWLMMRGAPEFLQDKCSTKKIFALEEDLSARGISEEASSFITRISQTDFVNLVVEYPKSQSWFS